jgi:hypothetical protein
MIAWIPANAGVAADVPPMIKAEVGVPLEQSPVAFPDGFCKTSVQTR